MSPMYLHHAREPGLYRAWLHFRKDGTMCARFEVSWCSRLTGLWFGYDEEYGWGGSIGLYFLYISLRSDVPQSLRLKVRKGEYSANREISLTYFDGSFFWRLWRDAHYWSSSVPRWREGSFSVVDFLLGPVRTSEKVIEERQIVVPMPEKSYPATAALVEFSWKRPRWFAKRLKRVTIDVPSGVPIPGKGENSWDCGDSAIYSLTTPRCSNIPEGVGILVGQALRARVRYGGWRDYVWQRPAAADPAPQTH